MVCRETKKSAIFTGGRGADQPLNERKEGNK